jgi:Mg-chelatase subunit ChlD
VTLVFDVSASMGTGDADGTRLQLARTRALRMLADAGERSKVRILEAGAMTVDRGEFDGIAAVTSAIESLRPQAGGSHLAEALRVGRTVSADVDVWVFTDAPPPSDPVTRVRWTQVGRPTPNVAMTALAARRLPIVAGGVQILFEISNFGDTARDATVQIRANDTTVVREITRLDPHTARSFVREFAALDGGISASVSTPNDGLEVDNERFALIPPRRSTRVKLITPGNFFLEKALASNPNLVVTTRDTTGGASSSDDLVICDACTTPPRGATSVLMIPPVTSGLEPAPLIAELSSHPIAQGVEGSAPVMPASRNPPLGDGVVVMRAGDVPLVLTREQAGTRIIVLNADLRSPAFPLSAAFPVLIANAVDWAAGIGMNPREVSAGEPLEWTTSTDATPTVIDPAGRSVAFAVANRHLTVTDTRVPGIYTVTANGLSERFAVNVPPSESNVTRTTAAAAVATPPPDHLPAPIEIMSWLLLAAIVMFAVEWWLAPRVHAAFPWRVAIVLILIVGAVDVRIPLGRARTSAVFVLDRSGSIPLRAQRASFAVVNRMSAAMHEGDLAGLVTFGGDAALDRRPSPARAIAQAADTIAESGTDIENAMNLARTSLPRDGGRHIVLVSDGNETSGDATREAALAVAEGIRVDVVGVDDTLSALLPVVRTVRAPDSVRVGEPFQVTVDVSGPPNARVAVALISDGRARTTRDVAIGPAGRGAAEWTDTRDEAGMYTYRAAMVADDFEDATAGTVVSVSGQPEVLYVSRSAAMAATLASGGFHLTRVVPESLPAFDAALARFDSVILDDVPASALTSAQSAALTRYVEQNGGGLLLLGSARSLEPGGYSESALASLLPVDLNPRSGRRAPSMAYVLVFDKSGSMSDRSSGVSKIELARESAMRVVKLMPATDSFGIIAFDATPHVIAPLASQHREIEIASKLREIEAGGATAIGPALDLAGEWLRAAPAARRHVLLVSDGRTSAADADRMRAASRMRGFELSVIAIGSDADRVLLETIAEQSGGRAYFPDDIRQLPKIVSRDASEASGGTIVNERFRMRAPGTHPVLGHLDPKAFPMLDGYVVAAAKVNADTILASHLDDPILAGWRFGLGRVAVFTADVGSRWSTGLRAWNGFAPLWTQTTRWLSRQATNDVFTLHAVETDAGARLLVEAIRGDGRARALQDPRVTIRTPSGATQELFLQAREPGRFGLEVPMHDVGAYQLAVTARDGDATADARLVHGFYWSGERERSTQGANRARLAQLAEMTGGQVLGPEDNPFDGPRPLAWHRVRSACALLALILFLLQMAVRADVTRAAIRRWWRNRHTGDLSAQEAA